MEVRQNFRRNITDRLSVRQNESSQKFWRIANLSKSFRQIFDRSVKKAISTKHFFMDILSVKISVKKATFRKKINIFPVKNLLEKK